MKISTDIKPVTYLKSRAADLLKQIKNNQVKTQDEVFKKLNMITSASTRPG